MTTLETLNVLVKFQFKSYRMEFGGVTFTKKLQNIWYSEEQQAFMFKAMTKIHRTGAEDDYYTEATDYLDAEAFASHVMTGIWNEVTE